MFFFLLLTLHCKSKVEKRVSKEKKCYPLSYLKLLTICARTLSCLPSSVTRARANWHSFVQCPILLILIVNIMIINCLSDGLETIRLSRSTHNQQNRVFLSSPLAYTTSCSTAIAHTQCHSSLFVTNFLVQLINSSNFTHWSLILNRTLNRE